MNPHHCKVVRELFFILLFTVLLTGCVANTVHKEKTTIRSPDPELRSLAKDLIKWIGENSDYEVGSYLSNPPEVSFCKRKQKNSIRKSDNHCA